MSDDAAPIPLEETIARVCHEANRAWCEARGDRSQLPWDEAASWQRESAVTGVQWALAHPDAPASAQHDAWATDKFRDGWTYGAVKDAAAKTHPCLLPFEDLPRDQQLKDTLFRAIVTALTPERPLETEVVTHE
jgi:hypothetical protein